MSFLFEFFDMENREILGFQFESYQCASAWCKSWEICSSADSKLNTFRWNQASVDTCCHNMFQLYSNTNNEGVLVLWSKHVQIFQNMKVVHYLFPILQIFFIKLISEHAITNEFFLQRKSRFRLSIRVWAQWNNFVANTVK